MDPISPSEIVHYKAEHNRLLKNLPSMEGQYCLDTRNSQCGDKTVRMARKNHEGESKESMCREKQITSGASIVYQDCFALSPVEVKL
jgi:hypothetical protein